jgi:hypothetical protein
MQEEEFPNKSQKDQKKKEKQPQLQQQLNL